MKPFEELNDVELVSLTEAEVTYYIDRVCAEQGIPLLPPTAPKQPSTKPIEDDVMVYVIAGMHFSDPGEASQIRDVLLNCRSYGTANYLNIAGSYRQTFKPAALGVSDRGIETKTYLSQEKASKHAELLQQHAAAQAAYEKAQKEYDKAVEGRSKVVEWTYERIEEARRADAARREVGTLYGRYLALSNDDHAVAARFLKNGYAEAETIMPELFETAAGDDLPAADGAVLVMGSIAVTDSADAAGDDIEF